MEEERNCLRSNLKGLSENAESVEGYMSENNWLETIATQNQVAVIMKTNAHAQRYGLTLSREEAELVLAEKSRTLKEQRRVELGQSIVPQIIEEFCDSAYLHQDNYVDSLIRLQEIFCLYKNEMEDEITDAELLHFMKEQFETICYGDLDYLEETCLDIFAQAIRAGYRGYLKTEGRGEYAQFDEVTRWDKELYLEALRDLCWR